MMILSAAAMLSLSGCKDDVVDFLEGCTTNEDCNDGQICNDAKVCVDDPADVGVCGDGNVDANEQCDDGAENSDTAADACRTDCTLPVCGDGVVDDGEACDEGTDGNDGVLCNADCTIPGDEEVVTHTLRCNSLVVVEPGFTLETASACEDVEALVNARFQDYVGTPDAQTGEYQLNLVQQFSTPLPVAGVEFSSTMSFPTTCTAGVDDAHDTCELEGAPSVTWTMVQPETDGPCFERIPAVETEDGWLDIPGNTLDADAIPSQGANTCLQGTTDEKFTLSFLGQEAELNGAYISAELNTSGEKPALENGMIGGFLTVDQAAELEYVGANVGTISLLDLLNSDGDFCAAATELDQGPDADGDVTDGFWLYVSFGAESVGVVTPE